MSVASDSDRPPHPQPLSPERRGEQTLPPAFDATFELFRAWARHPLSLFGLLVFLNALVRPYLGLEHDAMLYSGQVLSRLDPETYRDDLFFRYGSQDRFSVFSPLMAPLAESLGLENAFFAVYVITILTWIAGSQRLMMRLFPAEAAVPGLIYLVTTGPQYGGMGTFFAHEAYLTPRMMVFAAAVWGLDAILAGRRGFGLALLAGAMGLHPLMALPALVLGMGIVLADVWSVRGVLLSGAAILAAAVTAFPLLPAEIWPGPRYDAEWALILEQASPNLLARHWLPGDWKRNGAMVAMVALAAAFGAVNDERSRGYLTLTVFLGSAGAFLGYYVCLFPYGLPVMVQPYRALWLVAWVLGGAGFALALAGFRRGTHAGRGLGLLVLVAMGLNSWERLEFILPVMTVAFVAYVLWMRSRDQATADWITSMVLFAGLVGFGVAFALVAFLAGRDLGDVLERLKALEAYYVLMNHGSSWLWLGLSLLLGLLLAPRLASPACGIGLVIAAAVLTGLAHTLPFGAAFHEHATLNAADMPFARDVIRRHAGTQSVTVYSNLDRLSHVWVDLHARCYFDWFQTGGLMFNRGTAIEARRRAIQSAPFEVAHMKRHWNAINPVNRGNKLRFIGVEDEKKLPVADREALRRFCRDEPVDFLVVADVSIPEEVLESNGRIHIYDARAIRAK